MKKRHFKDHCVFAASIFALATMTLASHAYISCNTLLVLVFLPELEQARSSDGASCSVSSFTKDISIYAFLIFRETNSMCTHVTYFVKCLQCIGQAHSLSSYIGLSTSLDECETLQITLRM